MPINAKNIVVKNRDEAHIKPMEAPKPEKPAFEPPKMPKVSQPVEHRSPPPPPPPVERHTDEREVKGLFVKKRSKFLDDMLKS